MLISNLSLFMLLAIRWYESGHFPLSNLYESLMFLSWSLTLIHLFIEIFFGKASLFPTGFAYSPSTSYAVEGCVVEGVEAFKKEKTSYAVEGNSKFKILLPKAKEIKGTKQKRKLLINKLIGSITAPCALFTNAFATFSLPKEMQESSPLVPALQSNWLMMHVTVMILSYAALILGSLLSIGFLVISFSLHLPHFTLSTQPSTSYAVEGCVVLPSAIEGVRSSEAKKKKQANLPSFTFDLQLPFLPSINTKEVKSKEKEGNSKSKGQNNRLNLAKTLDNLSYRILGLGFPLLTIGILSGAVWANEAWGSYWSWDPKETWALLTWLVFAIYLHTRLTKGWEGKKPALIASLGFVTVWICFLGVNLIGEGLHSYGWLS